jgi:hypothetical protein
MALVYTTNVKQFAPIAWSIKDMKLAPCKSSEEEKQAKDVILNLLNTVSKDIKSGKLNEKETEEIIKFVEDWLLTIDRKNKIIEKLDEFSFVKFDRS